VADGNGALTESDDLDGVGMAAFAARSVVVVTPMSGSGSAGRDVDNGQTDVCLLHRSCTSSRPLVAGTPVRQAFSPVSRPHDGFSSISRRRAQ